MKRINILIVVFLCLLIPVWLQVTKSDKPPGPDFQAVSAQKSPAVSVPKEKEEADITFSITQVSNKPSSTLEQVYVHLSLVTNSKGPYWELLAYQEIPWEQSTFEFELVSKDGQRFQIDVLERGFKKNYREASLLLEPGQELSEDIQLALYLQILDDKQRNSLQQAFLNNELECEAKIRTRIAVPQPGEEIRFAKVETSVKCPLTPARP